MYREVARLLIYKNMEKDNILYGLADIIKDWKQKQAQKEELIDRIYTQIHRLLEVATQYGFNGNLWQNYLTYLLVMTENPFSITCEKAGAKEGSVNAFAKNDLLLFKKLFEYDFKPLEQDMGINCFQIISNYQAIKKSSTRYNQSVSEKVQALSIQIAQAKDENEVFQAVTDFYYRYGVGILGLNKAFRLTKEKGKLELFPITNTEEVHLNDLTGYEIQKKKLTDNTKAFVEGRKANNVLLFGDSGTGKSTSIKAILNEYYREGLRMIEIYKHQFEDLSAVIHMVKKRNYKFIIYMDDLSFENFETEYKYLKAVIEGGLEIKPDNVLIYATSNRRHLIHETWADRSDMSEYELHHSDTMQEKLSLVARFGITISFSKPDQKQYYEIVKNLAAKYPQITLSEEELYKEANRWELNHGGLSGRTAQQFVTYLAGKEN